VVLGDDVPEVNTPTELMVLNGILTALGEVLSNLTLTSSTRRVGQSFRENNNSNHLTTPREGEKKPQGTETKNEGGRSELPQRGTQLIRLVGKRVQGVRFNNAECSK
jgi:hypothetical protein